MDYIYERPSFRLWGPGVVTPGLGLILSEAEPEAPVAGRGAESRSGVVP